MSDNTHSAIVMNSPRLSTSDRATEFPVSFVWLEENGGCSGHWMTVMSDRCPNENTSGLGSSWTMFPCASGGRTLATDVNVVGVELGSRYTV